MPDVFAAVKRLAADYRTLADAYDEELAAAHNAGHGTLEALEHLRKANAMAPYLRDVLSRYQSAVAALAEAIAKEPPLKSCWRSQGRGESLGI